MAATTEMTVTTDPTEQETGPGAPAWRPPTRPSVKPALIVVLVAVVVVFGGVALALAGGTYQSGPEPPVGGAPVKGTGLTAVPAGPYLSKVVSSGQPPQVVVGATVMPAGAAFRSTVNRDHGGGQYDRGVRLSVDAPPSAVVAFYKYELPREGWGLLPGGVNSVDGGKGTELLYERAADAYYWEIAVIVTPESPAISPALAGSGQTAPTSVLEIDLLQVADGG